MVFCHDFLRLESRSHELILGWKNGLATNYTNGHEYIKRQLSPFAVYLLSALLVFFAPSLGYSADPAIVAVIGGEEITKNDLNDEIAEYGKSGTFQEKLLTLMPEGKREILNRLVKEQLLYRAALDEGVALNPEAAKRLERLKREMLVKQYVREVLEKNARTDGELYDYYLKHLDVFSSPEKRKIRHIVVKTQEEAQGLHVRLKAGENFEKLASEHNIDGTKDREGDLGWIARGVMVREFEQAAFSLPKGKVRDIVKTSFGWHLIRVEEIQEPVRKGFGQFKKQVKAMAEQETLMNLERELTERYGVKIDHKALGSQPMKRRWESER